MKISCVKSLFRVSGFIAFCASLASVYYAYRGYQLSSDNIKKSDYLTCRKALIPQPETLALKMQEFINYTFLLGYFPGYTVEDFRVRVLQVRIESKNFKNDLIYYKCDENLIKALDSIYVDLAAFQEVSKRPDEIRTIKKDPIYAAWKLVKDQNEIVLCCEKFNLEKH